MGTALGTRLPDRAPAPWPLSGADIAARTGPTALQRATDDADVQVVDEQGDSGSARRPAVLRPRSGDPVVAAPSILDRLRIVSGFIGEGF